MLIFVGTVLQHAAMGALTHLHLVLQLSQTLTPTLSLLGQLQEDCSRVDSVINMMHT